MNVHATVERFFVFEPKAVTELSLMTCLAKAQGWRDEERRAVHRALIERGCEVRELECRVRVAGGEDRRHVRHYVGARIRSRVLMGPEFEARAIKTAYVIER